MSRLAFRSPEMRHFEEDLRGFVSRLSHFEVQTSYLLALPTLTSIARPGL